MEAADSNGLYMFILHILLRQAMSNVATVAERTDERGRAA